jgi:hypothetical protein
MLVLLWLARRRKTLTDLLNASSIDLERVELHRETGASQSNSFCMMELKLTLGGGWMVL